MTKCNTADSIYGDICFAPGKKSLPGVRNHVYGIAKRDIVSWPTIGTEAPKTFACVDFIMNSFFGTKFESVSPEVLRYWRKKA